MSHTNDTSSVKRFMEILREAEKLAQEYRKVIELGAREAALRVPATACAVAT